MDPSNITVLTKSRVVAARKRKAKRDEIPEIVFDDEARREFLTGFRERKRQRVEGKQAKRKEREKRERLEARKQNRKLLAEQAAANAAQVEAAYGAKPADEPDASGSDSEEDLIQEEYENEEQVATVTVVEDFDTDTLVHTGTPSEHHIPDTSNQDRDQTGLPEHRVRVPKPNAASNVPGTSRRKTNPAKKIKYETKAARVVEKRKQRARKLEKAARAGGKQSYPSKRRK